MQQLNNYNQAKKAQAKTNQVVDDTHTFITEKYKGVILNDPWASVSRLMVTEKLSKWGICVPRCFEAPNEYELISVDSQGEFRNQVGVVKEQGSTFIKCCFERSRKFAIYTNIDQNLAIQSEKKISCFTCTPEFICCNGVPCLRPQINVIKDNKLIGRVENPFIVCGRIDYRCFPFVDLNVYDFQGNIKYFITSSCCQTGTVCRYFCCPVRCCCGKEIKFTIYNPKKESIGSIVNIYQDPKTECCSSADKFLINFPHMATYDDKLLLLHAALMIDYEIFEDCLNKP